MQLTFNITTSPDDLGRYGSSDSLADMLRGFDGVELMCPRVLQKYLRDY